MSEWIEPDATDKLAQSMKSAVNDFLDALEDINPKPTPASIFATIGVAIQVLIGLAVNRYPIIREKKGDQFVVDMLGTAAVKFGLILADTIKRENQDACD